MADKAYDYLVINLPIVLCDEATSVNNALETLSSAQLVSAILVTNPQFKMVRAIWRSIARIEQTAALDDPMLSHSFVLLAIDCKHSGFSQNTVILSPAVWVGMIALARLATEMGVLMMLNRDLSFRRQIDSKSTVEPNKNRQQNKVKERKSSQKIDWKNAAIRCPVSSVSR